MAKSLTSFKLCATTPNNTQQHCNNIATTCNRVCQWTQHVTFNNVESCWPTMLHPFAQGFRMKRPYRGVCMEAFDHILGDNFVIKNLPHFHDCKSTCLVFILKPCDITCVFHCLNHVKPLKIWSCYGILLIFDHLVGCDSWYEHEKEHTWLIVQP